MKKLFFKLLLAALPLILIFCCYAYLDPFMVLHHYDDLSGTKRNHSELNEDYVSTENFIKYFDTYHYDSYVFGSSRAALYYGDHLKHLFSSDKIYNYSVAFESLYGIEKKLDFLNKREVKIKNALLIVDPQLLGAANNSKGHLFRKHPLISGESNIDFQTANFIDIFDIDFIRSYAALLSPKKGNDSMHSRDIYGLYERLIRQNEDSFYNARKNSFDERPPTQQYAETVIKEEQKKLLINISKIFQSQQTNYIIIISPLYDQKRMSTADIKFLYSIYNRQNIFNFSGINDITKDMHNYYESEHYRIGISQKIMDSVYKVQHLQ